jgi:hypothetical protein
MMGSMPIRAIRARVRFKQSVLLALITVASLALATAAEAQLFTAWNTCSGSPGSTTEPIGFDCRPGTDFTVELFGTFGVTAFLPNVVAVDLILEFSFPDSPSVPAFWHFEQGGCNESGLRYAFDPPTSGLPCDSNDRPFLCGFSGLDCGGGITAYINGSQVPLGGANRSRLLATHARPRSKPVVLPALPARNFAFRLAFLLGAQNPGGMSCDGCGVGARVTWDQLVIFDNQQSPSTERVAAILDSAMPGSTGTLLINEHGTPTQQSSWGRLKSIYR